MNLGRVKSFLIFLFLGINIYLLISLFMSTRFVIDKKTVRTAASVLEKNNITVDEDIINRTLVNLKNIDTNNIIYTNKFKKSQYVDLFQIKNDNFAFEIESDVYFQNEKRIKDEVKRIFEKSGFETKHMRFGKVSTDDKGNRRFMVRCFVDEYEIFDSNIRVCILKDRISFRGTWYEPLADEVKSKSRYRDTVYITSVLVGMIENENIKQNTPFTITDIDYGYLAGTSYGEGAHVTTAALPYYRIKDNRNNVYYYDAKNGSYLK